MVTSPTMADYENEATRGYIEHYLGGKAGVPREHRLRAAKLVKAMTASHGGGYWEITSIHAEGSLAAKRLAVYHTVDRDRYVVYAKLAAGIQD